MSATKKEIMPAADRRGLSRAEAAAYVGISAPLFEALVQSGRMPRPKKIGSRLIWDRFAVDKAFTDLPETWGVTDEDAEAALWAP